MFDTCAEKCDIYQMWQNDTMKHVKETHKISYIYHIKMDRNDFDESREVKFKVINFVCS